MFIISTKRNLTIAENSTSPSEVVMLSILEIFENENAFTCIRFLLSGTKVRSFCVPEIGLDAVTLSFNVSSFDLCSAIVLYSKCINSMCPFSQSQTYHWVIILLLRLVFAASKLIVPPPHALLPCASRKRN